MSPSDFDADELEAIRPPSPAGPAALFITVVSLGLAAYFLFDQRDEVGYWLSSPAPVDLGSMEQFHADALARNRYARVSGHAGSSAARFDRFGKRYEIVALPGTNLLVRRALTGPNLPRPAGGKEPPPSQAPFTAEGRLMRDDDLPAYDDAFAMLVERQEAQPNGGHLWVLLDGDVPRSGWQTPGIALGLLALLGINLRSLLRTVRARRLGED